MNPTQPWRSFSNAMASKSGFSSAIRRHRLGDASSCSHRNDRCSFWSKPFRLQMRRRFVGDLGKFRIRNVAQCVGSVRGGIESRSPDTQMLVSWTGVRETKRGGSKLRKPRV